jgi:hypothetical protein
MLQMPGVVSSFPPLEADAFHMAKTDDNFHLMRPLDLLVATIRGLRAPCGGRPTRGRSCFIEEFLSEGNVESGQLLYVPGVDATRSDGDERFPRQRIIFEID